MGSNCLPHFKQKQSLNSANSFILSFVRARCFPVAGPRHVVVEDHKRGVGDKIVGRISVIVE